MSDFTMEDIRRQIVELLPRLRRFGRSLTGDRDRADDLVQETCVRALSKLDQWERGTRLDSWLYRIAQNLWLDGLRAAKVRGELMDIDSAVEIEGVDGRSVTDARLDLDDVQRAMGDLSPDQRLAISLVCIEGLSYLDAADVMKVPIGTLMSRLGRGRRALFVALHGSAGDVKEERPR